MHASRWWRERHFEQSYRKAVRKDLARLGKQYEARFKEAKEGNDFDATLKAYLGDCRLSDLRLETLRSRRLRKLAEKYGIDLPREWWEHDDTHDLWYLSPIGRRQLKKRVTQERIWNLRQWLNAAIPAVAMLVGVVGIVIGLIAVWRAH
jgi:hypothetical protein